MFRLLKDPEESTCNGRDAHLRMRRDLSWVQTASRAMCTVLLVANPSVLAAQILQHHFGRVTVADGLASYRTFDVAEDTRGFLWIGTLEGLNRYDGYTMRVFRHDERDSTSISEDIIRSLLVDRSGTLWAGTDGHGLNRFDGHTEHFTRFLHQAGDSSTISAGRITALLQDRSGTIWIGTLGGGLNRLQEGTMTFVHYTHDPSRPGSLASDRVYTLFEDPSGKLWVGTDAGLSVLDERHGSFTHFRHMQGDPGSLSSNRVRSIAADDSLTMWIATEGGGLNRFDGIAQRFTHYRHDEHDPGSISHDDVSCICQDRPGRLWVGTSDNEGGLNNLDIRSGRFTRFRNDPLNPWSLLHNYVRNIRRDRAGVIWIVTDRGLGKIDERAEQFHHYVIERNLLAPQTVYALWESHGALWIGANGLKKADLQSGALLRWNGSARRGSSIDSGTVHVIFEDRRGALWVGTTSGGVDRLDLKSGRSVHYELGGGDRTTFVLCINEDLHGSLWIGTSDAGLLRFDGASQTPVRFTHNAEDPSSLSSDAVYCLYLDHAGTLWAGTEGGGLNRFDPPRSFTHYRHKASEAGSLDDDRVYALVEDSLGGMWVATNAGLNAFDRASGSFRSLAPRAPMTMGAIMSMVPDDRGHLWLSTMQNGIWRLDPQTGSFRGYNERDGLQSDRFTDAALKRANGEILFGGERGFTLFHPDSIRDNPHVPEIVLTSFSIFDHPIRGPLTELHELLLKYNQNYFSFEFAALDLSAPEKNQYAYRLDGIDTAWVYPQKRRFATYTNIDPGTYTLRVRGSNNDGVWNEQGLALPITITPPFWATWWFRSLMAILVIAILTGAYQYRVAKLLEMERMRLRIASDLHDDIGSSLSSIALITDMVRKELAPEFAARERLADASQAARQTADALKDIVWIINPEHDTFDDIILRMKDAASKLLIGIDYRFDCPDGVLKDTLAMEFRRHLWLIYKESLHNIAKYAHAKNVNIAVSHEGGVFRLRVADDGVGFDEATAARGNGLRNLRARASKIGGTIEIASSPGKGTTVSLQAPLS